MATITPRPTLTREPYATNSRGDEQIANRQVGIEVPPTRWHSIGKLEASRKAAALLAKHGLIDLSPETNQYRLKPMK